MQISETSIRRPVFATVLSLLIVLIGMVSFYTLTVREYPQIDEPVVTVRVKYAGASAEVIETQVAKPLEDSIAGIDSVDVISSISRAEQAQITVRFLLAKDPDTAAAEVRDRVSRVRNRLPDEIDEPVIAKVEADAFPVLWLAFSSDSRNQLEINDLMIRIAKPRLQTVPGVADTPIYGSRDYAMRIWLEPQRLAAYGLTVDEVEAAIRANNLELPAGRIESAQREFNVVSQTDLTSVEQFANIVIKTVQGYAVRLKDVARIEEGAANLRSRVRFNGVDSVSMGIVRQATANPLDVSAGVRAQLEVLRQELPEDVQVSIANDSSVFIERSIASVYTTIVEAVVLVVLVIFVFLRTLRASIIPIITIPVSLIGAFALMSLAGFTINTLTLLAMVLAIGLVVDDAIVMLENIYRHIEEGMEPFAAAIVGAKEIGFAIVAMTMTLVAVYAPLAFTPGRTGRLFAEFALALAGAVLISGVVALTLSPMLCSVLLKHNPQPNRFDRLMERSLNGLSDNYARLLRWTLTARVRGAWGVVLQARSLVLLVMLGCSVLLVWLYPRIPSELAPMEDRGTLQLRMTAPDGASLEYTDSYARQAEELAKKYPEFDTVFANIGYPSVVNGNVMLRTVDWAERSRSVSDLSSEIGREVRDIPGVYTILNTPPPLGMGMNSRPLQFVILTNESYEDLYAVVQEFMQEMANHPAIDGPDVDLRMNTPELRIQVDRERAADLGVSASTVARTLETMLGSRVVTRYKKGSEQYDVMVQVAAGDRMTPQSIEQIHLRSSYGAMVPLSAVVTLTETASPRELNHFGQRRSATLTARINPGHSLGEALDFMDEVAARVLPVGYATDLNGTSREYRSSQGALTLVFALALVFIYLVLAAQFESFVDPLVIMVSVPMSMAGALLALKWSGGTMNVYSQIGLITLVGLITKHGILIVEFANQMRQQGTERVQAVVEAARQRLRPILMTTGAMVLGAMPLALATGAGAESRVQIGWVIVGGMTIGTLLTIFVVPTVYLLFARARVPGPRTKEVAQPSTEAALSH
ncbi:efflux RND transporter permease subunit [Lampropedia aestuarii]|uniref:efflux RND transporter permease subunit n=1 Tax=Lampropedia aestuarii TaxID=2562762 RepID=UPI0024697C13|nr:efflux RND transporter permease subunit [Lampropedia aestuarii]MDH5857709.1 efflux RND transporter permease subunit [Lampropedia aestuarii]